MKDGKYEIQDVEQLRDSQTREDHYIEYKAGESFNDTESITIDVSAFANASGGLIVYGMTEI